MPEGLGWWAVEERDKERVVGNVVLQPAPYDETTELGYHLAHVFWGRGYATEAAGGVLRHGLFTLRLPVVSAVVHVDNRASQQVAAQVGLRAVGPKIHNGMPHILYKISREEALALKMGRIRGNLRFYPIGGPALGSGKIGWGPAQTISQRN